MEDTSLMNPDHLKSEIKDLEKLVADISEERIDLKEKRNKIIGYIAETHNRGENSTLTREQVTELIQLLSAYDQVTFSFEYLYKFQLKVYKHLMRDRRWIVG